MRIRRFRYEYPIVNFFYCANHMSINDEHEYLEDEAEIIITISSDVSSNDNTM